MTITRRGCHQAPVAGNQPLFWHGFCLAKFLPYDLGPYRDGRRAVRHCPPWASPTWLSDKRNDVNELQNLATANPDKLRQMQRALRDQLLRLQAPGEQLDRLGVRDL